MSRKAGYGGYALAVLLISIAIDGVLFSTGYGDPLILVSLPLVLLGLYTVFFSCLGFSLFLTFFTGNLLLNLSVSLIIIVVVGVIVSKVGKR